MKADLETRAMGVMCPCATCFRCCCARVPGLDPRDCVNAEDEGVCRCYGPADGTMNYGPSEHIHVVLTRAGLIANDVDLASIRRLLARNAPADCDVPPNTLVRQVLDLAQAGLRSAHAYIACLPDGAELWFTGEALPPYTSAEALLAAIARSRVGTS